MIAKLARHPDYFGKRQIAKEAWQAGALLSLLARDALEGATTKPAKRRRRSNPTEGRSA